MQRFRIGGSKSISVRHLLLAGMAAGRSRVSRVLACDDTAVLIHSLRRLGVVLQAVADGGWEVTGRFAARSAVIPSDRPIMLDCGESGAVARFLLAIAATSSGRYRLRLGGRLPQRPLAELTDALGTVGVRCSLDREGVDLETTGLPGGTIPLGPLRSGQTLSALLLSAPLARAPTHIVTRSAVPSSGYVELTTRAMAAFGIAVEATDDGYQIEPGSYRATETEVEGDWSSAAYLLTAGAITGRGVAVDGLAPGSEQPDRRIVEILEAAGCRLSWSGSGSLAVDGGAFRPLDLDLDHCPDLAPTVAVLAALVPGRSELRGLGRLREKESDRLRAVRRGLERVGVEVTTGGDTDLLRIVGGNRLRPARVDGARNHRIVMAFSLLRLREPGIEVGDHGAVAKSYPKFFEDLQRLLASSGH